MKAHMLHACGVAVVATLASPAPSGAALRPPDAVLAWAVEVRGGSSPQVALMLSWRRIAAPQCAIVARQQVNDSWETWSLATDLAQDGDFFMSDDGDLLALDEVLARANPAAPIRFEAWSHGADAPGGERVSRRPIFGGECEDSLPRGASDCDGDGTSDACEIAQGMAHDLNFDGVPDGCQHSDGDMTCDGSINGYDIEAFILALTAPDAYLDQWSQCNIWNADVSLDGSINGLDIEPFIRLLAP